MTAPLVSVIIPAYNVERYLRTVLESVRAQSLTAFECIVVDDGSRDATLAVAREAVADDPRFVVVHQANGGVSSARNNGTSRATGETILFLDGDDWLHPTALERLHTHLAAHPDSVGAFGTTLRMDAAGVLETGQKAPANHHFHTGDVLDAVIKHERIFSNGGQLLLRRAAVERAGEYDTRLALNEDWEFWCRVAALGPIDYIASDTEVLHLRVHPDSAATRLAYDHENHRIATETVLGNRNLSERYSPKAWRAIAREIEAGNIFEAGRQSFRARRFGTARRQMARGIWLRATKRRLAIFALAQLSQIAGRPLIGRLRFID